MESNVSVRWKRKKKKEFLNLFQMEKILENMLI